VRHVKRLFAALAIPAAAGVALVVPSLSGTPALAATPVDPPVSAAPVVPPVGGVVPPPGYHV
jgi:hypothetical protein